VGAQPPPVGPPLRAPREAGVAGLRTQGGRRAEGSAAQRRSDATCSYSDRLQAPNARPASSESRAATSLAALDAAQAAASCHTGGPCCHAAGPCCHAAGAPECSASACAATGAATWAQTVAGGPVADLTACSARAASSASAASAHRRHSVVLHVKHVSAQPRACAAHPAHVKPSAPHGFFTRARAPPHRSHAQLIISSRELGRLSHAHQPPRRARGLERGAARLRPPRVAIPPRRTVPRRAAPLRAAPCRPRPRPVPLRRAPLAGRAPCRGLRTPAPSRQRPACRGGRGLLPRRRAAPLALCGSRRAPTAPTSSGRSCSLA
jgi:hypothetical protein